MEEQKKYFIISTIMFVVIAIVILQVDKYHDNKVRNSYTLETNKLNNQYINVNDFGIYLQDKENSNNYVKQPNNNYPTEGYILNTSRTKCFDYHGSEVKDKVTQTDEGRVRLETTVSIYCQMYFDIDNTKPKVKSITISGTDKDNNVKSDYIYNYDISYTVTWEDSDVVYYCVKEGSSTCTESDWQKTNGAQSISGTITVNTEGTKTIYAYVRDKARNVSEIVTGTSNAKITVDRTSPTISEFTLTGTTDNGTSLSDSSKYTHTTSVSANITWTDSDVASYCITTSSSCSTSEWTTISSQSVTKSITTSAGQGNKSYNAFIKDKAGNVSTAKTGSIYLDTEKPTATISLNTSTETSITVTIGGTDSGSGIVKRECRVNTSSWVTATGTSCTVSGLTDGTTYTVEARTIDKSGRVSSVVSDKYATIKAGKTGLEIIKDKPAGLSEKTLGGLYRFYGACNAKNGGCSGKVDNFICFGTDDPNKDCVGKVDSDYMYRIIGIDPDTGDLKLIKNSVIREETNGIYQWASSQTNNTEWPNSSIYKRLNGLSDGETIGNKGDNNIFIDTSTADAKYLTSSSKWYKMIKDTDWLYGDSNSVNTSAEEMYKIETGKKSTYTGDYNQTYTWTKTVQAKIGLMYIHDYYYAYEGKETTNCYATTSGYTGKCMDGWLHMRNNGKSNDSYSDDTTMTRYGRYYYDSVLYLVWRVYCGANFNVSTLGNSIGGSGDAVRPVFYLDSTNAKITLGTGTGPIHRFLKNINSFRYEMGFCLLLLSFVESV